MSKESIHTHLEALRPQLQNMALDIWAHPEAGFHETYASNLQKDFLRGMGAKIIAPIDMLETAFVAEYGEGQPIIGLLGEFDALPGSIIGSRWRKMHTAMAADTICWEPEVSPPLSD